MLKERCSEVQNPTDVVDRVVIEPPDAGTVRIADRLDQSSRLGHVQQEFKHVTEHLPGGLGIRASLGAGEQPGEEAELHHVTVIAVGLLIVDPIGINLLGQLCFQDAHRRCPPLLRLTKLGKDQGQCRESRHIAEEAIGGPLGELKMHRNVAGMLVQ